jgi:hypothetical protein
MDMAALDWLNSNVNLYPGVEIGWRDGSAMKTYVRQAKSGAITKILNEHFFQHPLEAKLRARGVAKASGDT